MGSADYIIIAVIAVVIGFAAWYVYKSKKSGKKCIGCPAGCSCPSKGNDGGCGCGCGCGTESK